MFVVDRDDFASWCEGVLLDFSNGVGFVVNEKECLEAEDALQRGETVALRAGSKLTGTGVVLKDGGYREVML